MDDDLIDWMLTATLLLVLAAVMGAVVFSEVVF